MLGLSPLGGAAPPEVAVRQDEHWWREVELLGTQLIVRRASDGRRRREGDLTVSLSIKFGKPGIARLEPAARRLKPSVLESCANDCSLYKQVIN